MVVKSGLFVFGRKALASLLVQNKKCSTKKKKGPKKLDTVFTLIVIYLYACTFLLVFGNIIVLVTIFYDIYRYSDICWDSGYYHDNPVITIITVNLFFKFHCIYYNTLDYCTFVSYLFLLPVIIKLGNHKIKISI